MMKKFCVTLLLSIILSNVNAQGAGTFYTEFGSTQLNGSAVEWVANLPSLTFVQSFTAALTPPFTLVYDHDTAAGVNIKTCQYSVDGGPTCSRIGGDCTSCTYSSATNTLNVTFVLGLLDVSKNQSTIRYSLSSAILDQELVEITVKYCDPSVFMHASPNSNDACGYNCARNFTCDTGYKSEDKMSEYTCLPNAEWSDISTCKAITCGQSIIQDSCGGSSSCCNSTNSTMPANSPLPYLETMNVQCCDGYDGGFGSVTCIDPDNVNSTLNCKKATTTAAPTSTTVQPTASSTSVGPTETGSTYTTSPSSSSTISDTVTCDDITDICEGSCDVNGPIDFNETVTVGCTEGSSQSTIGTCTDTGKFVGKKIVCTVVLARMSDGTISGAVITTCGGIVIAVTISLLIFKFKVKWPDQSKVVLMVLFISGIIVWIIGFALCFAVKDDDIYPKMTGGQIAGTVLGSLGIICLVVVMGCFIAFKTKEKWLGGIPEDVPMKTKGVAGKD